MTLTTHCDDLSDGRRVFKLTVVASENVLLDCADIVSTSKFDWLITTFLIQ